MVVKVGIQLTSSTATALRLLSNSSIKSHTLSHRTKQRGGGGMLIIPKEYSLPPRHGEATHHQAHICALLKSAATDCLLCEHRLVFIRTQYVVWCPRVHPCILLLQIMLTNWQAMCCVVVMISVRHVHSLSTTRYIDFTNG